MPLVLIILIGVLTSGSPTAVTFPAKVYLYADVGIDNKAFSENIVLEQPTTSDKNCARLCLHQPSCVTFTFGQEVCRGHAMMVTSDTSSTPAPGARSFARESMDREWQDTTCDNNDACAEPYAVCFTGLCTCSPGYYYSQRTKTCLSSCEPSKLTEPFQEYKRCAIHSANIGEIHNVTPEHCLQGCMDNAQCLSVDYDSGTQTCHQKDLTALTVKSPHRFATGWDGWTHYQKSCA